MVEYSKINCKLTNVQLNKLKEAVKSNEGASLRLGIKNFNKDELPHELLLITTQNTNVFNTLREYIENKVILDKIDGFDKIRFSSDIDLPFGTLIQFKILAIIIRYIIKKDGKYYPEIYLDECMYDKV